MWNVRWRTNYPLGTASCLRNNKKGSDGCGVQVTAAGKLRDLAPTPRRAISLPDRC